MKKRFLMLGIALMIAAVFTGCGKKEETVSENQAEEEETEEEELTAEEFYEEDEFDTPYGPLSEGAQWGNNCEGSAVYLDGTTAVVTIDVSTKEDPFFPEDLAELRTNTQTALDFISEQAKKYGANTSFAFNEEDLNVSYTYDGEYIDDFESEDYEYILEQLMEEDIDNDAIREKYKAEGILYLFLINAEGEAFSMPHWYEDETDSFYECAFIYRENYNNDYQANFSGPNVMAYHILRLFGAVELGYPDASYGYTTKLCELVKEKYQDDVMVSIYEHDGSISENDITKQFTDITAYTTGLTDNVKELKEFKDFVKKYKATFEDNYMANTQDNMVFDDYEYEEAFEIEEFDEDEDFDEEDAEEEEFYEEESGFITAPEGSSSEASDAGASESEDSDNEAQEEPE